MTPKDRLIRAILDIGVTFEDFEKRCGMAKGMLSKKTQGSIQPKTLRKILYTFPQINPAWLLEGKGNMYTTPTYIDNSTESVHHVNGNVVYNNNREKPTEGEKTAKTANRFGDSNAHGKWAPVIPPNIARMSNTDTLEYITSIPDAEQLYCGRVDADCWLFIEDSDLEGYRVNDCLGLKSYPIGKEDILPNRLYVVNTKTNGMVARYLRYAPNNTDYVASCDPDGTIAPFTIHRENVIRVYRQVLMFRYG